MEHMGASDEEAPPTNVNRKDLTEGQQLEATGRSSLMVVSKGVPLSTSPKGSMWHTPQFGDYGSEWHARMQ